MRRTAPVGYRARIVETQIGEVREGKELRQGGGQMRFVFASMLLDLVRVDRGPVVERMAEAIE